MTNAHPDIEWLEPDGLGGFASGTASGIRSRRYHAVLLAATTPPTGRRVLVNGFDAWVETGGKRIPISTQLYAPAVRHPDGDERLERFESEPWPTWTYRLEHGGASVVEELLAFHGHALVAVTFSLRDAVGNGDAQLVVRPFLSGRDYHALHHENPAFRFDAESEEERLCFAPYADNHAVTLATNGTYRHDPLWYRNFQYEQERERGLDFAEDLASPGELRFDLGKGEAVIVITTEPETLGSSRAVSLAHEIKKRELERRSSFPSPIHRAADAYIVRRRQGNTIVAGYPWFTDWGRDTFIAMRGLCLASGRLEEAEGILLEWADAVSEGMLPNRFPDGGETPEFNSVDASLWYVVAVADYLERATPVRRATRDRLLDTCQSILEGYSRGTRFAIHEDIDSLLAAGEPGVQLTWMDAKVGDWVVTPRIGKPVEVQALWLNALKFGSGFNQEWKAHFERGMESFQARFWYEEGGHLFDVIDVDHVPGTFDASFRPNQIFAVGGLPESVLRDRARARRVVEAVEQKLWTPFGLRSLAPEDSRYVKHYEGGVRERDGAYHQGTVWPWLAGAFIDAYVRVKGSRSRAVARDRFLRPLIAASPGGHLPEIADAEHPHRPRGCPFQAWSVGELLRASEILDGTRKVRRTRPTLRASEANGPEPSDRAEGEATASAGGYGGPPKLAERRRKPRPEARSRVGVAPQALIEEASEQ